MKKALKICVSLVLTITIILSSAFVGLAETSLLGGFGIKSKAGMLSESAEDAEKYTQEWSLVNPRDNYDGTYSVDVKLKTNYPCSSVQFYLNVSDMNALELLSVTMNTELASDFTVAYMEGSMMVAAYCIENQKPLDGVFATLEFVYYGSEEVDVSIKNDPKTASNVGGSLIATRCDDNTLYFGQSVSFGNNIIRLPIDEDGLEFELSSDETFYMVSGYKGEIVDVVIPSVHNGLPVLGINEEAFLGCTSLKSVLLPDSMVYIGASAFADCENLTSVTFGDELLGIGSGAFYNCKNLVRVSFPDSVMFINEEAFSGCLKLSDITLPDGIQDIDSNAFYDTAYYNNNSNWENDVLYLGNYLIKCKTSFTGECNVRPGTKAIVNEAFKECKELTAVTIPGGVTTIGARAFSYCSKLVSVEIADTVTSIGISAFVNCVSLTDVDIPDSVTELGNSAFNNCTGLKSVSLGNGITFIDNHTFYNCSSLSSIVIPENVTSLGEYAFYNCKNLVSVAVPEVLKNVGDRAFYSCDNLSYVFYGGSENQWKNISKGENNIRFVNAFVHYNSQDHSLENIVSLDPTCTQDGFLEGECSVCGLHYIKEVPALGHDFSTEWTIDIEATEMSEGEKSHHCLNCDGRTDITPIRSDSMLGNMMYIETDGFKCDGEITYVIKLKGGIGVSGSLFNAVFDPTALEPVEEKCGAVATVDADGNENNNYGGIYISDYKFGSENTFIIANMNVKETVRSKDTEYIKFTFRLKDSSAVKASVAFYCAEFSGTPKITKNDNEVVLAQFEDRVNIPAHTITGDWVYDYKNSTKTAVCSACGEEFYETFVITDILTFTKDSSGDAYTVTDCVSDFSGNIEIPDTFNGLPVTSIGAEAFRDCINIKSITIADSVTDIGASAFRNCASLCELNLSDNITRILGATFFGCAKLEYLNIPDGVERFDGYAFGGCTALKSVVIPDSVNTIGGTSFVNCNSVVIFCNENSAAHSFAVSNNYSYVISTAKTKVNLAEGLVFTDVLGEDADSFISGSENITYSLKNNLAGTGAKLDILKDTNLHSQYTLVVNGDTNGDSVCDVLDCFDVERVSSGNSELSGVYAMAGDINSDEIIDINDYQAIVNKAIS